MDSRSGLQKRKIISSPIICPLCSSKQSLIVLSAYRNTILSIAWIIKSFNVRGIRTDLYRQRLTCLQAVQLKSGVLPNVPRCDIQYNHMHSTNNRLVRTSSWLFSLVVLRVCVWCNDRRRTLTGTGWKVVPGGQCHCTGHGGRWWN